MSAPMQLHDLRDQSFFKALVALPYVDAIYVYGSYSMGFANESSDVDIAVECPDATDAQWEQLQHVMSTVPSLLSFDVVRMDKIRRDEFYHEIIQTRSLLYLRHPKDHLEWVPVTLERATRHLPQLIIELQQLSPHPEFEQLKSILTRFNDIVRLLIRAFRRALLAIGIRPNGRIPTLRFSLSEGWLHDRVSWEQLYVDWELAQNKPALPLSYEILARMPAHTIAIQISVENLKRWYEKEAVAQKDGFLSLPPTKHHNSKD